MGEYADLTFEWEDDEHDYDEYDCEEFPYTYVPSREIIRCVHCGKTHLIWREILEKWVLFEANGNVHICEGYSPPIKVLKQLFKELIEKSRIDTLRKIKDRIIKGKNSVKEISLIPDHQLIDLYTMFICDDQRDHYCPDVGMSFPHDKEIEYIKQEILKRMTT
jgi:hypothetical protein